MASCLIVIDAQESFRHRPYFDERGLPAYLAAQNALIEGFAAAGAPIVRVFHSDGPAVASNSFALESGHVRPLEGLAPSKRPPPSPSAATARWSAPAWTSG